jgi:CBS-domain-containing membrane protein
MFQLKNPKVAVPVVLFAGLIWSFGPLVVRYMDEPHLIPWQYIFGRGLTIFILLNVVHPPAGGNPIIVIIGSVSYEYLISPIIFGCIIILLLAILVNKFILKKNYPLK